MDYETDRKIQDTIATEFQDRTILCIAHRLRTIISYDRICVLDAGQIFVSILSVQCQFYTRLKWLSGIWHSRKLVWKNGRNIQKYVRALRYNIGRYSSGCESEEWRGRALEYLGIYFIYTSRSYVVCTDNSRLDRHPRRSQTASPEVGAKGS